MTYRTENTFVSWCFKYYASFREGKILYDRFAMDGFIIFLQSRGKEKEICNRILSPY